MSDIRRRISAVEKTVRSGRHEGPEALEVRYCIGEPPGEREDGVHYVIFPKELCDELGVTLEDLIPRVAPEDDEKQPEATKSRKVGC